ncbi:MAG: ABC transporter ATP-binding protein, partial [Actinomycetota bacterium]
MQVYQRGQNQAVQYTAAQEAPAVSVRSISKIYGPAGSGVLAVENLSLEVARGEFVCLVGASGCGKSTLLKLIAGLGSPGVGEIAVNGRTSLLFQEAALFPWLTARKNIELALKLQKVPAEDRRSKAAELLDLVHLTAFADKRPHELSGGMRQRVALARALAQQAQVILMDEPFASLDAITRDVLYEELEQIWE